MGQIPENEVNEVLTEELRLTADPVGFSPSEMTTCEKCGRQNPPNRFGCLYCSAPISVSGTVPGRKLVLRSVERWENGTNLITSAAVPVGASLAEAAAALGADLEFVREVVDAGVPLPIARIEPAAAQKLAEVLAASGVECIAVEDQALLPSEPPVRLRKLEFTDGELKLIEFNTDRSVTVAAKDATHLISGTLFTAKAETTSKRTRNERMIMDEAITSDDVPVIDLYTVRNRRGYRVLGHGFDFSGIGEPREILAARNMEKLIQRIKETVPGIRHIDSYTRVRGLLDPIWPTDERTDPTGVRRSGLGRIDLSTVRTTSNLEQFTRFSRLQSLF